MVNEFLAIHSKPLFASLFNSGVLTDLVSKVVKLSSSDLTAASDFKLGNVGRVNRECSFDTDSARNLAKGNRLGDATVLNGDAKTFEQLKSFFVAFTDAYMYLNGISRPNSWCVGFDVSFSHACQNSLLRHIFLPSVSFCAFFSENAR